ncbi:MAG: glycosyltransferase family 1 protein, partial [Alphaproteobacteria bacterium]|nr:glycosyltransferase family 1 protein [Alphaproteobacteria bacterium]
LKVPFGPYDIKTIVDRLPPHQRPDVLVVALDATRSSVPRNLAALDCPKALLIGDTHHLETPLGFMIGYVFAETFDLVVGNHLPQHLHFFRDAGQRRLAWIPGIWVHHYGIPFRADRPDPPVFIGHIGAHHGHRRRVLESVRAAGLPLDILSEIPPADAARRYSRSVAALNSSLNGDFNMRVFETLGHGACLLTDRLAPEAGLTDLFGDGEALVCYDDPADLIEKLRATLARPAEALAIARRGFDLYQRDHRPEHKAKQLFSELVGDGRYPAPAWRDPRAAGDSMDLMGRIATYEYAQDLQRGADRLSLFATRGIAPGMLADLVDLVRLSLRRQRWPGGATDATAPVLEAQGYDGRIPVDPAVSPADVLLMTSAELAAPDAAAIIAATRPEVIVLADATAETTMRDHLAARRYGFARTAGQEAVLRRLAR